MSRRRGNVNENLFMAQAEALGYCAFAARGSRGCIDVVCFESWAGDVTRKDYPPNWYHPYGRPEWPLPALAAQVGTNHKPIAATLAELEAAPRPIGSLCIVARRMARKGRSRPWKYTTRYGTFDSLEEAISAR